MSSEIFYDKAFIRVEDGEMYIYGMHISPYEKGNIFNKDPLRVRKLLLHKKNYCKYHTACLGGHRRNCRTGCIHMKSGHQSQISENIDDTGYQHEH